MDCNECRNIRGICDSYDEFERPIDPECRLTPLAERVYGIIAEVYEKYEAKCGAMHFLKQKHGLEE